MTTCFCVRDYEPFEKCNVSFFRVCIALHGSSTFQVIPTYQTIRRHIAENFNPNPLLFYNVCDVNHTYVHC